MERTAKGKNGLIPYKLTRRQMKSIILKIEQDGTVAVSAGKAVPYREIDDIVISCEDRINKRREELKSNIYYINENCKFYEGDIFYIWGEKYIIKASDKTKIDKENRILYVNKNLKNIKSNVESCIKRECKIVFENLSKKVYNTLTEYKGDKPEILIKKMKSCWGICYYEKGKIILNSRLSYYPKSKAQDTVYHEYVHFIHHNHSKEFYQLLNKYVNSEKDRGM